MDLYDGTSSINWKDGLLTREQMDGDLHYPPSDVPCVLFDDQNGIVYDWLYLKVMCNEYDIEFVDDLENYNSLFDMVLVAFNNENPTIEYVSENTNANTEAIAELGVLSAENSSAIAELGVLTATSIDENAQAIGGLGVMAASAQSSNADLLQAVGELGVQIAELSAKIEQLQTPAA